MAVDDRSARRASAPTQRGRASSRRCRDQARDRERELPAPSHARAEANRGTAAQLPKIGTPRPSCATISRGRPFATHDIGVERQMRTCCRCEPERQHRIEVTAGSAPRRSRHVNSMSLPLRARGMMSAADHAHEDCGPCAQMMKTAPPPICMAATPDPRCRRSCEWPELLGERTVLGQIEGTLNRP